MLSLSSLAVQARSAVLAGPELGTYGIYGESFAALIILTLFIAGERLLTVAVLKASAATSNERQRKREGCIFARGQCLGAVLPSVHWIARVGRLKQRLLPKWGILPLGTTRSRHRRTCRGKGRGIPKPAPACLVSADKAAGPEDEASHATVERQPRQSLENPTTGANARVLAWSRRGRG